MTYKIAELKISSQKNPNISNDVFVAQPDSIIEKLAGKLFVCLEIESETKEAARIVDFLVKSINNNYYQNEKILLREKIPNLKIEHIFEASLAKTNKHLASFLEKNKIRADYESFHVTAGIIHEDKLYFANSGRNKILLSHKTSSADEFKISNISELSKEEKENQKTDKLFSNVLSGKMPKKGAFLITNETLPEYVSNKQLTEILSTLPPLSAVEQIKNKLPDVSSYISFLCIVIKEAGVDFQVAKDSQTSKQKDSIVGLATTENETENLLSPNKIPSVKIIPDIVKNIFKRNTAPQRNIAIKDSIFVKKKTFPAFFNFFTKIKNGIIYLFDVIYYLVKLLSQKFNKKNTEDKIGSSSLLDKIKFNKKILLYISLVFLVLFVANSFFIKIKNKNQETKEEYSNLTKMIEQKQNQIDAKLLYSNDEGAKKLFDEIEDLISQLPKDSEEQRDQYSKFEEKVNKQLEKIRRVTNVNNLTELANFSNINDSADPQDIIFYNGKAYSSDSSEKNIYTLETENNLVTTIPTGESQIENLQNPIISNTNSIYYRDNDKIFELNLETEKLRNIKIQLPDNTPGIASYGNRIYALDTANNQINRYRRSGAAFFSSPYAWVSDTVDELSEATDLSIDGNIYVLLQNGTSIKLTKGAKTDFELEKIDPSLENPTKITASEDLDFLYVLEPSQKRIVLFDKNGQFILQYKLGDLEIKDFSIDEENKIMYILSGSSVYGFEASHITD